MTKGCSVQYLVFAFLLTHLAGTAQAQQFWAICDSCTAAQMKSVAQSTLLAHPQYNSADVYVVDRDDGEKRAYLVTSGMGGVLDGGVSPDSGSLEWTGPPEESPDWAAVATPNIFPPAFVTQVDLLLAERGKIIRPSPNFPRVPTTIKGQDGQPIDTAADVLRNSGNWSLMENGLGWGRVGFIMREQWQKLWGVNTVGTLQFADGTTVRASIVVVRGSGPVDTIALEYIDDSARLPNGHALPDDSDDFVGAIITVKDFNKPDENGIPALNEMARRFGWRLEAVNGDWQGGDASAQNGTCVLQGRAPNQYYECNAGN